MSLEESRQKLHRTIDMHAKFHHAAIELMGKKARDEVARFTEFHLFGIANQNFKQFNEQRGSTK